VSTSNVLEKEHSQLHIASTVIDGKVVKDANFEDVENNKMYSLPDCHMKIICEGMRRKWRKGAGNVCNDSSVKVENSTKVREANSTESSDGTQNTLKSTRQDQQLNCIVEKKCARCSLAFIVTSAGKYVTQDQCVYHWGKLKGAVAPWTLQPNKVVRVTTSRVYNCTVYTDVPE
jgi:hypothetical protein